MLDQLTDPNISTRIDGVGLREGVAVADGWWAGGIDVALAEDRATLAEAMSRSWLGRRDPYYPAGGAG